MLSHVYGTEDTIEMHCIYLKPSRIIACAIRKRTSFESLQKKSSTQQISVLFIHVQPVTRDSSQRHCITLNKQKFAPHRGPCPQHANKIAYLSTVGQDCSHHEAEDANCSDRFLHLDFLLLFFLSEKLYQKNYILSVARFVSKFVFSYEFLVRLVLILYV